MFSTRRALKYALGIWTVTIFLTAMEWAKIDKAMRGIHLTLWYLCLLASTTTQILIGVLMANIQPLQLNRDAGFSKLLLKSIYMFLEKYGDSSKS